MRQSLLPAVLDPQVSSLLARRGGLLGLATLAVYAWLAPAHILGGDNAEFVTLGRLGGVAHPSGYPLYVLWLRATAWIPASSAAHAAALATAVLASTQIVVLHAACRAWGAGAAAATVAVAIYAGSPIAMTMHSQAEVFALNGLAASAILLLSAPGALAPARGARRAILLGLAAGLALSNHLSAALLLPIGLAGVVRGLLEVEAGARRRRVALTAAASLVLGLTPYLYLLVAPGGGLSWGDIAGVGDIARHVLRRDYGTATLTPHGAGASAWQNVAALGVSLTRSWWGLGLALGVGTLGVAAIRSRARAAWSCLAASLVLAGPALVSLFNVAPTGMGAWIAERFHLLPSMILAIPVAVGLDRSWSRLGRPLAGIARWAPALAIAAFFIAAATSLDRVARAHSPAVDRLAENLLRVAPEHAVLLIGGDHVYFGLSYAQLVQRRRPDVTHITWDLMTMPWYRRRVSKRLGFAAVPAGHGAPSVRLAEAILARGRPLLVDAEQARILAALPSYPFGPAIRVLPRGTSPPPPADVLALNRGLLERQDLNYPPPERGDGWAAVVHAGYALPWRSLADALGREGRTAEANEALDIAAHLDPK